MTEPEPRIRLLDDALIDQMEKDCAQAREAER